MLGWLTGAARDALDGKAARHPLATASTPRGWTASPEPRRRTRPCAWALCGRMNEREAPAGRAERGARSGLMPWSACGDGPLEEAVLRGDARAGDRHLGRISGADAM
ncbi:MAG: hypothetical protein ACLVB5_12730 [Christensenellales bacterium]